MIYKLLKSLDRDESGQDLIEYGLIAALIAVALVTSMGTVASGISNEFSKVVAQLQ
jgi:pilus assembly protein Flp/PilA